MSPLPKYPKKIRRLFDSALEYEKSGRPGNASEVCRKILRLAPRHEKTLLLLNRIAMQSGDYALSISLMEKAVKINPRNPEYHYNLGLAYNSMGKIKEALSCMKHATSVKLDYVAAWVGLGNIMFSDNRLDEAKQYYSKAIQLSPDNPSMHYNIGLLNRRLGDLDGSSISFQRTLSINPEFIQAYIELGNNCQQKGEFDEAEKYFRIVLERDPANAVACNGLGYCMQLKGELEQAYDLFNKAILLQSEYSSALTNIGNIFQLRGFPDEAINFYRKALSYSPGDMNTFQNLLGTMNYTNRFSPSEIYAEHVEFYNRVKSGLSVGSLELFSPRDPDKRLKVGYVSPDFRGHAVSRFIEPVMSCHNRNKFEIFSYYNFSYSDEVTERLIEHCDHWVNISNFSDEEVQKKIRDDEIDILVDLSGHSANNRLRVFAYRPAPIQITWLGYPNTTGLDVIDYRITDEYADPVGTTEAFHSERLFRMPDSFLCYGSPSAYPDVSGLPASENRGIITFGSFNNISKVTKDVICLWANVLLEVPDSRLILKYNMADSKSVKDSITRLFGDSGVSEDRILFLGKDQSHEEHLQRYNKVDIALDPYPYHGTTTTYEALWMGVPVVTLTGKMHVSRVGCSILRNLGLDDFVADSREQYIEIAAKWANDIDGLRAVRTGLRSRIGNSVLMDAGKFTRNLEKMYRSVWIEWCQTGDTPG